MAWVKLDDCWYDNPKLLDLDLAAVGLWVVGLTYCNRHLTDGHIPARALGRVVPDYPEHLPGLLVERGLWVPVEDGWQVHDYHDYQPTAEAEKEKRRRRQEAGRKGGLASGEARASANRGANAEANRSTPTRPVPTPYSSLAQSQEDGALTLEQQSKKAAEVKRHLRSAS